MVDEEERVSSQKKLTCVQISKSKDYADNAAREQACKNNSDCTVKYNKKKIGQPTMKTCINRKGLAKERKKKLQIEEQRQRQIDEERREEERKRQIEEREQERESEQDEEPVHVVKDRLNLFTDMWDIQNNNCTQYNERPRLRNPRGNRCRIITKSKEKANGFELFHNKIKKWINRKNYLTTEIMKRIKRKLPNLNKEGKFFIFKIFLMALDRSLPDEFRINFVEQIKSNNFNNLPNKDQVDEYFRTHYTANYLYNPKSSEKLCIETNAERKIKSENSKRCVFAYRKDAKRTAFEDYADFLINTLENIPPNNIFFSKLHEKELIGLSDEYFEVDSDGDDGSVSDDDGSVSDDDGSVSDDDGSVSNATTISDDGGSVSDDDGSVSDATTISDDADDQPTEPIIFVINGFMRAGKTTLTDEIKNLAQGTGKKVVVGDIDWFTQKKGINAKGSYNSIDDDSKTRMCFNEYVTSELNVIRMGIKKFLLENRDANLIVLGGVTSYFSSDRPFAENIVDQEPWHPSDLFATDDPKSDVFFWPSLHDQHHRMVFKKFWLGDRTGEIALSHTPWINRKDWPKKNEGKTKLQAFENVLLGGINHCRFNGFEKTAEIAIDTFGYQQLTPNQIKSEVKKVLSIDV